MGNIKTAKCRTPKTILKWVRFINWMADLKHWECECFCVDMVKNKIRQIEDMKEVKTK